MKFAVVAQFRPNDPKTAEVRPVHRVYLSGLLEQGKLAISGPYTDGTGALIVLEADTLEEAEAMVKADPFAQAGVFASYEIHPWNPVFANPDLLNSK